MGALQVIIGRIGWIYPLKLYLFIEKWNYLCDLVFSVLPVGLVPGPGSDLLLGRKDLRFVRIIIFENQTLIYKDL